VKLLFPIMFCFAPAVLILLTAPAVMQLEEYLRTAPTMQDIRGQVLSHQQHATMPLEVVPPAPQAGQIPVRP